MIKKNDELVKKLDKVQNELNMERKNYMDYKQNVDTNFKTLEE